MKGRIAIVQNLIIIDTEKNESKDTEKIVHTQKTQQTFGFFKL